MTNADYFLYGFYVGVLAFGFALTLLKRAVEK